ncbi:hypothetical protein [Opitutus sp. ER46]|uniref:hypothetical protein n=1 Tax=Opitutus sp. ER46 TaxID=2161864 RepID=UPI000D308F35|nr:hypothetical protein [Opitutus sp. ER46]PTX94197.1 hypothetical protein DB354_10545 [Opitutus sp. ER46]
MKVLACVALLAVAAVVSAAETEPAETPRRPRARLAGETVHVRLVGTTAYVQVALQFDAWLTSDPKYAYVCLFSTLPTAEEALSNAGFELRAGGRVVSTAERCAPPRRVANLPRNARAFWFRVNLDELADETDRAASEGPFVVKFGYSVSLVDGRFHYVPVIAGFGDAPGRRWEYQMHARSITRPVKVVSDSDYEPLGDAVTVYLRDAAIVTLE